MRLIAVLDRCASQDGTWNCTHDFGDKLLGISVLGEAVTRFRRGDANCTPGVQKKTLHTLVLVVYPVCWFYSIFCFLGGPCGRLMI